MKEEVWRSLWHIHNTHVHISNVTLSKNLALYGSNIDVKTARTMDPTVRNFHSIQMENSVVEHGSGYGAIHLTYINNFTVTNCRIQQNTYTALSAISSKIFFQSNNTFIGNTGVDGGAIRLCSDSFLVFRNHTHIRFINNHAENAGGAIFVQEDCNMASLLCFFQLSPTTSELLNTGIPMVNQQLEISLEFENNTAAYAGNDVYGGFVDFCVMVIPTFNPRSTDAFNH